MSPDLLRILILAAVFAAVMLFVERLLSTIRARRGDANAINERMALISRGVSRDEVLLKLRRPGASFAASLPGPIGAVNRAFEKALAGAGLKLSVGSLTIYLALAAVSTFILIVVLLAFTGSAINPGRLLMSATFAAAAGFGLPAMVLSRMADSRRKKIREQFPVALDIFVRGLRAGHPVSAALELVTKETGDPMGTEFGIALDEVTYGAELRDALQSMADRCGVEDIQMFVVCLSVQGETGGNLAEILENLAQVIRDRASMLMKVRALSSEGRMTGVMLTILPVASFVLLFILNPNFYFGVADDPYFIPGLLGLLVSFTLGVLWIRKLVDLKV